MDIQLLRQDDPITQAIDAECQAGLTRLCGDLNIDPTSACISMAMLLLRQVAIVDLERTGLLSRAISDEIQSNWSNPNATQRRVTLTTELASIARETARAMAEANEARASGQIS